MNIKNPRLDELETYGLLNHRLDEELQELSALAKLLCDVTLAQITLVDQDCTWIKAETDHSVHKHTVKKVPRKNTFCHHAIQGAEDLFIITDATSDQRFQDNPYVLNKPNICFYAAVPLKSKNGYVLGTLCILDTVPRELSKSQRDALKLLGKRTKRYLERHREMIKQKNEIKYSAKKLRNLTNNLPVGIFQMSKPEESEPELVFFNKKISQLFPHLSVSKGYQPEEKDFFNVHDEDKSFVINKFFSAFEKNSNMSIQYRVEIGGAIRHYALKAKTERNSDGVMQLFGCLRDVTERLEYEETIEQIAFDISHVIRRPVSSILGLCSLIENDEEFDISTFIEYADFLKKATNELDEYTRTLNEAYQERKSVLHGERSQI